MVRYPDREQRQTAEVDIHITIGRYEFALEHTVLEAAERVTENYESVFVSIRKHLTDAFPNGLPSQVGYYYLILPVEVAFRDGQKARQRRSRVPPDMDPEERGRTGRRVADELRPARAGPWNLRSGEEIGLQGQTPAAKCDYRTRI